MEKDHIQPQPSSLPLAPSLPPCISISFPIQPKFVDIAWHHYHFLVVQDGFIGEDDI